MPRADFFQRLGIFAARGFLSAEECRAAVAGLAAAGRAPATIYRDSDDQEVDERSRRASRLAAPDDLTSRIGARLSGLRAALEEKFGLPLGDYEELEFLSYGVGDFFGAHLDASPRQNVAARLRRRRVSVVLFLNGQSDDGSPGTFSGGSLVFYGLVKDARAAQVGFPLVAEPGLLVAFPSDLWHEVTPVTGGERYTAVTWFADGRGEEGRPIL
ncbi:MAG TPA: 2OG-Fe(II) oxygenase [Pyrinomonadaceae bacterium]|nr:2OG-Fe(II) oxygenase [Pyrinomonadaceae bacterium]